ncbi:MAG: DNA repair protein RecN [Planctomycetota bacterium]
MLIELAIRDLALIERADLEFGPGLNVVSGETGAGKSLLVDALGLLLGSRARAALVRRGAERARVEGRFVLPLDGYGEVVARWLREHLPEALDEREDEHELELVLARTVGADGKSRAHVNHRPATQGLLRDLAALLVEVHGQHDNQALFEPAEQLRLLDTFAGLEPKLGEYVERRRRWLERAERLVSLDTGETERLQRLDLLRFQVGELSEARPVPGEDDGLRSERAILRHAAELGHELGAVVGDLSEGDTPALDAVRRAERVLERWAERIGDLAEPAAALREASALLEDAARALTGFLDGLEHDPVRLEEVEARLTLLERLARKHGVDVGALAARREALEAEVQGLSADTEGREQLEAEVARLERAAAEAAQKLGEARAKALKKLAKAVESGLADLGLERAKFSSKLVSHGALAPAPNAPLGAVAELERRRRVLGPTGAEDVEFLLAANPGEEAGPLRHVASGGEAARILLALRGALAVKRSTPTLVFDEVDAGVGGRLGPKVASHLEALGEHHQVLCVTHLPAIAARAARHLCVAKEVSEGRTRTSVRLLAGEARVAEIADMIAGGADAATARAEAVRLLAPRT